MSLATLLYLVPLIVLVAIVAVAPLRASLRDVIRQRAFLGAVILLGLAAVGLNAATQALQLNFRKQPVPLAVSRLDDTKEGIPSKLGKWVQVSKDEPLDHAVQEALGTKEFVFRDYVDSTLVSPSDVSWFTDKSAGERAMKLAEIQARNPQAVVKLAITYYTGMVDTVPHVPEKCYVADGFEPTAPVTTEATAGAYADGTPRKLAYRNLHFRDATGSGRVERDVAYLFHVNGGYQSSSIGVRDELANLFQPYAYFAKVELMTTTRAAGVGGDGDGGASESGAKPESLASFNDLLAALLPEVERCLPDWNKVTATAAK